MTTETEQEYSTVDYVRAALSGDALKAKEIFSQLMAPKVVDAIDAKKLEVAQNYFTKPEIEPTAAEQRAEDADESEEQTDVQDSSEQDANNEEEKDENAEQHS